MLEAIGYVILGLILLMVPGFLFSTALYPKPENLDFWKRMGASLGLGAMLAAVIGYAIAMPGVSTLSLGPFVAAISIVSVTLAILTYVRGGFAVLSAYKNGVSKVSRRKKAAEPQTKTLEEPKITK